MARQPAAPHLRCARVAIVERYGSHGGALEVALSVARELRDRGWDARLILLNNGNVPAIAEAAGIPVEVIPLWRDHPAGLLSLTLRLRRALRRQGADLVVAHGSSARLLVGPGARLARLPVSWHVFDPMRVRSWRQRVLSRLQALVRVEVGVLYSLGAQRTVPQLPGRPRRLLDVFPPVDLVALREVRTDARPALDLPTDARIITMLARFAPAKGHLDLVAAFAEVAADRPHLRLVMCGGIAPGDPYVARVRAAITAAGLDSRVLLAGHVPVGVRNDLVATSELVVHPAPFEPFGLIVVEAMAVGTPVVAADAEGPAGILGGKTGGALYPAGDRVALADLLRTLLDDPGRRQQMALAGPAEAEEYGLPLHVDRLVTCWEAVLRGANERSVMGPTT